MAAYKGNIGFEEVLRFFTLATENNDVHIIMQVKLLIEYDLTSEAWEIIEDYIGVKIMK